MLWSPKGFESIQALKELNYTGYFILDNFCIPLINFDYDVYEDHSLIFITTILFLNKSLLQP
ncbi:MAG: hypothetical protein JWP81_4817 [Ferruginibacter sp.]|nr:hypothetical protein [Ferruginibacter sp.]